jgi:outer membrane protein OmpA-like peptidoglycan-associated protein
MTELACFFLMIYALSVSLSSPMQKTYKEITDVLKQEKISGQAQMTQDGLQISLEEKENIPFFAPGSAELTPAMKDYIQKIAPALKQGLSPEKSSLLVEGHTDNVPIKTTRFASNWELSTARATTIVRYLIDNEGVLPNKIAAIGYGEYRPIVANDNDQNKAKNRRVVFLIKTTGSGGAPGQPAVKTAKAETETATGEVKTEEVKTEEPKPEEVSSQSSLESTTSDKTDKGISPPTLN